MTITVVTPTYNREDCILRCMESVRDSLISSCDVEHIIVDDGSTDHTFEIVDGFSKQNNHVKYIKFNENRGTNAARNQAILMANGEYCVFLDSDDYFDNCIFSVISETVNAHPEISHFCFAPDHMVERYENNPLLRGCKTKMLSYEDFLVERVKGDFFHVMKTEILRRHPFKEELRIHEGIFFMALYKEAQNILFTNKIVNHIERGRKDTVKRETFRNNRVAIERTIKADQLFLNLYTEDLKKVSGGTDVIQRHLISLYENHLLLGDYHSANQVIATLKQMPHHHIPFKLKFIHSLRLGYLYFIAGKLYFWLKYDSPF